MDEAELKGLWAQDAVPARDLSFELGVMARIEQNRFRRALAMNVALAGAGAVLLALLMPTLQTVWQNNFAAAVSNWTIAVALSAIMLLVQRWIVRRS